MANILVIGTFAIDYIGNYNKDFSNLPDTTALNVSVQLDHLRKGFGGCAMNMAVALHRLGHRSVPFAYTSELMDVEYDQHLNVIGLCRDELHRFKTNELGAHALIVTDQFENQFTAFYPGPVRQDYSIRLEEAFKRRDYDFAVVAPDEPNYMLTASKCCIRNEVDFIVDPGQCSTAFSKEEMEELVDLSSSLCVNQHEFNLIQDWIPKVELELEHLFVTHGSEGVHYWLDDTWYFEPAVKSHHPVDPTGCGDAFRAGLVHALLNGSNWHEAVQAGCVLATINLEHAGTQLHSLKDFRSWLLNEYQGNPSWLEATKQDA